MRKNICDLIGVVILFCFAFFFLCEAILEVENKPIKYDEAYNATVAANYFRHNTYKVSYPQDLVFYNLITTGATVLLPTAYFYKLFGVNYITSNIVAIIYGLCGLFLCWYFLFIVFKNYVKNRNIRTLRYFISILTSFAMVYLICNDVFYWYLSTHLIGEIATICFSIISIYFLYQYVNTGIVSYAIGISTFSILAFLTKNSMIFFCISILFLTLFETFYGTNKQDRYQSINPSIHQYCLYMVVGYLYGLCIVDTFKFFQLGSLSGYMHWWIKEWGNMFSQSGGNTCLFIDKFRMLKGIFGLPPFIVCVEIFSPIGFYLYRLYVLHRRKEDIFSKEFLTIVIIGLSFSSLIIYFLFFGKSGLMYPRRLSVSGFFIRLSFLSLILLIMMKVFKSVRNMIHGSIGKKSVTIIFLFVSCVVLCTISFLQIKKFSTKINSGRENNIYEKKIMDRYIEEVRLIPQEATIYVCGWWQEPNITLFLDRKMVDITSIDSQSIDGNSYFCVGHFIHDVSIGYLETTWNINLTKITNIEVDYSKISNPFNRVDFDNYSIYKVIKKDL